MSLLVVQLPPRQRLAGRGAGEEPAAPAALPAEWPFWLADDAGLVLHAGQAAPALLPRADRRVLVLAAADVAWHRLDLPKAPAARLRAALAGVLEDALLDDTEALHLALAEGAAPGRSGWVAVTDRARLAAALAALEAGDAGAQGIDRVVAAAEPVDATDPAAARRGHFHQADPADETDTAPLRLTLSGPDGVAELALDGSLARALVGDPAGTTWTATPAAAAAAERWLGQPLAVLPDAQRLRAAAERGSNLRQFELAPRRRGTRALREGWRVLASPPWRPVRWGLAALLAVQLLGLNAHAWQQRQQIESRKAQMVTLLRQAHPGVPVVLDAPLQMQRETDLLRGRAGRAGPGDFEALLAAAAGAWPDGVGPAPSLRFEPGRLTLAVPGWGDAQWQQFQQRLRASGHAAEFAGGQVSVLPPAAGRRP
ncbi:MAG: type II secretion system protein GspL [Burkholderiaceae bacterium]|jgi:general secretion pathway protein L|nr:type II secretion system protein GspL [Burkholderiaceae bacterium]MCZ8173986.1 type II secretion system protein GspL [Burkholderiaceae bacterium]